MADDDQVTDDDDLLAAFGGDETSGGVEDQPGPPLETTGSESQPSESPPPPEEPQYIEVAGEQLTPEAAQGLVEFYKWAQQNPDALRTFDGYLAGEYELVPRGQYQQAPPPEAEQQQIEEDRLKDVDPAIRQELEELRSAVGHTQQLTTAQMQARYQQGVEAASQAVRDKYGLSEDDLQRLMVETARQQVLPVFYQQTGDPRLAAEKALDTVFWSIDDFRDREIGKRLESDSKQRKRQSKQAALSGNSGSVPREQPVPNTEEGRREAMVQEIAQAMSDQ